MHAIDGAPRRRLVPEGTAGGSGTKNRAGHERITRSDRSTDDGVLIKAIEALREEIVKMDERSRKSEETRERQSHDQFNELRSWYASACPRLKCVATFSLAIARLPAGFRPSLPLY